MAHHRAEVVAMGAVRAVDLHHMRNGRVVRIAGLVICRQRPGTAKGFMFLSLEDETGIMNAIATPDFFERHHADLVSSPFLLIDGTLQNLDGVISVKAGRVKPLRFVEEAEISHDFR